MNRQIVPVILSGGAGSRLWPLSRELHPKQFFSLADEFTLLQGTARRLAAIRRHAALAHLSAPIVVCNEAHRFMVREQLQAVGVAPAAVLLEPAARDTAPAIAAAALQALAQTGDGGEPILLILPVDHVIRNEARFSDAVREALTEAVSGRLVTFGVPPAHPETGYGYILAGAPAGADTGARRVERFVEKPDAAAAAAFVEDGRYFWNSGMFVFGAGRYLRELRAHAKDLHDAAAMAHRTAEEDLGFLRLDADSFAASPSVSVDHAVMERASDAVMVPLDAGWSDIGSWAAVSELGERDAAGNVARGDVVLQGTRNTYVRGADRLVAAVGVTDLVIADTADAVLVAAKGASQDLRHVVATLASAGREEHRRHRMVHRPWGLFDVLHGGDGFKVKRIVVNPGERLSLQSHRRRAEHWIVVRGAARVTRGEETFTVSANQSTYIPPGTRHRLENPGPAPLELVEVQTGDYLGEDDIIRHDDAYGRSGAGDSGRDG